MMNLIFKAFCLFIFIFKVTHVESGCPAKWIEHNSKCYFFSKVAYRFNDALTLCSSRNASLFVFHNDTEWDWFRLQIQKLNRNFYWTGLRIANGSWTWIDGTPYNKSNVHWYRNKEPSAKDLRHNCGAMVSYKPNLGMLFARYCLEGRMVVCEKPNDSFELCDSGDDWDYVNNNCYKLFNEKNNWFDARAVCQQYNGDLYLPTSSRMTQSIADTITCRTPDKQAWIGISDIVKPGQFWSVMNKTLRYQAWNSYNKIILKRGGTCVYSNPMANFYWETALCTEEKKFLCEKPAGTCPTGWENYLDNCYQVNDLTGSKATWFLAKQYCEQQNTTLLIIENAAEDSYIQSLMLNQHISSAWLGFSDASQSDSFQWVNGNAVTGNYTNWSKGYPKPTPSKSDCGKIQTGPRSSAWSNGYCFVSLPFICKAKVITRINMTTPKPAQTHCEAGWLQYRSDCYYFGVSGNSSGYSWLQARHTCYGFGADLTTIRDPYEQSFIIENQQDISTAWIGLKYSAEYAKFMWVDQTSVQFSNYYPGEPDDYLHGQQCIKIVGGRQDITGSWDDGNCSTQIDFICRKKALPGAVSTNTTSSTTPGSWSAACGPNWISNTLSNTCYQVVLGKPKTWNEALWDCSQMGASLLSIEGVREQNYIQAILNTGPYAKIQTNFWIGGSDHTLEGGWEWVNTTLPFAYLNWHTGEPNEALIGEDCMEMVPSWGYQWNDKRCDHIQQYICKKQAIPVSTTSGAPTPLTPQNCVPQPLISGDYSVLDTVITASSSADTMHSTVSSRIYQGSKGGWSAGVNQVGQYIQVEFYNMVVVKGVMTMGRSDAIEWVTSYRLKYQYDKFSEWTWYEQPPGTIKNFTGNTDNLSKMNNTIQFPIEAKVFRLYPVTWHRAISLRWELLGCIEDFCVDEYGVSGPLIVPDTAITATSISDPSHGAAASRLKSLNPNLSAMGWEAAIDDSNQWIQVDLGKAMIIRGITTMGSTLKQEWVTSYQVIYRVASRENFYQEPYGSVKTIVGNVNNNDTATYFFKGQFQARYIKIVPVTFHGSISLRFDVLVCQHGCNPEALINGKRKLSDDLLNASSFSDNEHGPSRSRLNQASQGAYAGGWSPKYMDSHQYIEADLEVQVQVVAIATQGREDRPEWVTEYKMSYTQDGSHWFTYDAFTGVPIKFAGNFDSNTVRKHYLSIPIIARKIRLWPTNFQRKISIRWEIYGCPGADSGIAVGCYADNPHDRDLVYEPLVDPTVGIWPPMCVHHCFNNGYYFAGIQSQYKCFCGNSYGRYGPAKDCNLKCYPQTRFQCGGPSSNMIYSTGLAPINSVCLPNWKDYNGHCYLLLRDRRTWAKARSDCQQMGADLATVNSQPEQDMIYSIIINGGGKDVWIGLNDIREENLFEWVRGDRVKFTNWNVNQPSQKNDFQEDCVMINSTTGGWQDEDCNTLHQYVCEADKRPSEQPTTAKVDPTCEKGWSSYRWSCYLFIDMPRSFTDAQKVCRDNRATLVQVDDRFEQSYLSSVLGKKTGMYWTDVTDTKSPGTYRYSVSNYPYLLYTNWGDQRPAAGTRRCVAMKSGDLAGLWYDILCNMTSGAVCEKTRIGYTHPTFPPSTTANLPCPDGWIDLHNGYCYQVNMMDLNKRQYYDGARQDCQNQGADLASFHNFNETDTLWRGYLVGSPAGFWIGLDDRSMVNSQKLYQWKDGSALDYVNWSPNQPDNYHGTEDCVEIFPFSGKWNDASCWAKRNWICKIKKGATLQRRTTMPAPSPGPAGSCGVNYRDWLSYKGHCYYIYGGSGNLAKTWREARRYCQGKGAELLSINSVLEQFFIQHQIMNVTAVDLWTGFSETDFELGYKWSDGSPSSYVNWSPGEPNDFFGAEDCAEIRVYDGKWNDAHCSQKRGFVCEKNMGATAITTPTPLISGNCPAGFSGYRNKCYRVYTLPLSWNNASHFCTNLGRDKYYLASVNSPLENAFITTLLKDVPINPWLGLTVQKSGELRWADNYDVVYTNWNKGEPNGWKNLPMCGIMYGYQHNAGKWGDIYCNRQTGFVCETKKKSYITTAMPTPNPCNAKQGFQMFGTSCYKFFSQPMDWVSANSNCASYGSYLVTISSEFEQAFVTLMLNDPSVTTASSTWIGLNDQKQQGTFTWINTAWPVVYTNWNEGQPNINGNTTCVSADQTGKWNSTSCNITLPSICKIDGDQPPETPTPPNDQCEGSSWILNGSKCYLFEPFDYKTNLDATLTCQQHRATLVSVHSYQQNQNLIELLYKQTVQSEGFWIGLHKSASSGFQWSDVSPTNYLNWNYHEPSGKGQRGNEENCVEIYSWNGKWNDADCSLKRGYVCQRDPVSDINGKTTPPVPHSTTSLPSPSFTITYPKPPLLTTTPRTHQTSTKKPPGTHKQVTYVTYTAFTDTRVKSSTILPVTGQPQKSKAGAEKSSNFSLSTGGIVGILAGVIGLAIIAISILLIVKKRKATSSPTLGFENTIYKYNTEKENGHIELNHQAPEENGRIELNHQAPDSE